jgi:hypothetical protein
MTTDMLCIEADLLCGRASAIYSYIRLTMHRCILIRVLCLERVSPCPNARTSDNLREPVRSLRLRFCFAQKLCLTNSQTTLQRTPLLPPTVSQHVPAPVPSRGIPRVIVGPSRPGPPQRRPLEERSDGWQGPQVVQDSDEAVVHLQFDQDAVREADGKGEGARGGQAGGEGDER